MEKNRKFLGRTTGSVQTIISALPTPARSGPARQVTAQKSPRPSIPQRPNTPTRSPRQQAVAKGACRQQKVEREPLQELPLPSHPAQVDVQTAPAGEVASGLGRRSASWTESQDGDLLAPSPGKMAPVTNGVFMPGRRMAARAEQRLHRASSAGPRKDEPSTFSPRIRQASARRLQRGSEEVAAASKLVSEVEEPLSSRTAPAMERVRVRRGSAPPSVTELAASEPAPSSEIVEEQASTQLVSARSAVASATHSQDRKSQSARLWRNQRHSGGEAEGESGRASRLSSTGR